MKALRFLLFAGLVAAQFKSKKEVFVNDPSAPKQYSGTEVEEETSETESQICKSRSEKIKESEERSERGK